MLVKHPWHQANALGIHVFSLGIVTSQFIIVLFESRGLGPLTYCVALVSMTERAGLNGKPQPKNRLPRRTIGLI